MQVEGEDGDPDEQEKEGKQVVEKEEENVEAQKEDDVKVHGQKTGKYMEEVDETRSRKGEQEGEEERMAGVGKNY